MKKPIPIACTLDVGDVPGRVDEWRTTLAQVANREPIDGGVRLTFAPEVAVGPLAELLAAEQACCAFFAFALTVDERGIGVEVSAPPDAIELVNSLFGESV